MEHQNLLDQFAGQALNALIVKSPFIDLKGELGKEVSEEGMREFKRNLTESAYEYAEYMLIAREKAKLWLAENNLK